MTLEFSRQFFKNNQISNFKEILTVGVQLFVADRRTDKYDEGNSRFCEFSEARNNQSVNAV
jgi:hypothetical protein